MDLVEVRDKLEAYIYQDKRVRLALIDVDTEAFQMLDLSQDKIIHEGNFRDYVIALAEQVKMEGRKEFVMGMSLEHIQRSLLECSGEYSIYYELGNARSGRSCERAGFWRFDEAHLAAVFTDAEKSLSEREAIAKRCDSLYTKMKFLAKYLTLFFCEADIETHACRMLGEKSWMQEFTSFEEQMDWILDNFVKPEDRQRYQKLFELENVVNNAKIHRDTYELILNGAYKQSDYIVKLVFHIMKVDGAEAEKLYFYGEDISEIKAQEDKNKQLLEISRQLLEISQNDGLTGLYNKTAAEKAVRNCTYQNLKNAVNVLIMIDVDHFKYFNDEYGHMAGDEVLKHVAESLKNAFRSDDIVCRWGGDEFMVLMKSVTSIRAVKSRLERLRLFMKALEEQEPSFKVTLSIGAAVMHQGESFDELFQRTDELLYQVKKGGRDAFCIEE